MTDLDAEVAALKAEAQRNREHAAEWKRLEADFENRSKDPHDREREPDGPQPSDTTGVPVTFEDTVSPEARRLIELYSRMADH